MQKIENGRADFPDEHFDLVFSNQVLEHVTDPEAVIADMCRLVKPGGTFISAFPVTETWYEGHIGLYFVHRFPKGSRLRQRYFDLCHRLGFGIHRGKHSRATSLSPNAPNAAAKVRRIQVSTRGREITWRRIAAANRP